MSSSQLSDKTGNSRARPRSKRMWLNPGTVNNFYIAKVEAQDGKWQVLGMEK